MIKEIKKVVIALLGFILVLGLILFAELAWCDDETGNVMYCFEAEVYWDNFTNRDTAYNYIVSKTTGTVKVRDSAEKEWDIIIATSTNLYCHWNRVRFKKAEKGRMQEMRDQAYDYIFNNKSKIVRCRIRWHVCTNNDIPGAARPCNPWHIMYSKNW